MEGSAINFVVEKFITSLANETTKFAISSGAEKHKSLVELPAEMDRIECHLRCIQGFLKDIARNSCEAEFINNWLKGVRSNAYAIEDIELEYLYVVGEDNINKSFWDLSIPGPQTLLSLIEIATEVQRIRENLRNLCEIYNSWPKPESWHPVNLESKQEQRFAENDDTTNDESLVGIDTNIKFLIESLHSDNPSLKIIAVWGMAGIGKSTLVRTVYNNEISKFDCYAWISLSKSYKEDDILKSMLHILGEDKTAFYNETESAGLIPKLKSVLNKKRYFIVLDDVWTTKDFCTIKKVLVYNELKSRVVITSRTEEVAILADEGCKIKVKPLNHYDAWNLFCKKAFPKILNHTCPLELMEWAEKIVHKCDGLPLALEVIGNYLSPYTKNDERWCQFYEQINWELHNNRDIDHVKNILNLSYKYLPDYLKNCFLYCSMFPEDYLIPRKRLIRLWIAEGFIIHRGERNLEDTAQDYLTELTQRSMLQVAVRNSFGRIKYLRMHDLVREIAINQSQIEGFYIIGDEKDKVEQLGTDLRHVSVFQCNNDVQFCKMSRLHTFITFDNRMPDPSWYHSILKKAKYLAVLDLSGLPIMTVPDSVGDLFNLRLLCLSNTKVTTVPKRILNLHNLQTLSLAYTQALNLPEQVSKLEKLRNISAFRFTSGVLEGIEPFNGLWNLNGLQTLGTVKLNGCFAQNLGNLLNLRSLSISNVKTEDCAKLCNSFSKMHHLSTLQIIADKADAVLHLGYLTFPNPLKKIDLFGRLCEETLRSPFFRIHGNKLLQIHLVWSELTDSQFSRLCELSNLTEIMLGVDAYAGQQLYFHKNQLQKLKKIYLKNLQHVNQNTYTRGIFDQP